MHIAVVDYSRFGHTRVIAEDLARALGAERREIRARREHGYPFMGLAALLGLHFGIEPMDLDFSSFDLVVLCTPIWAGRPANPTRTFLRKARLDGRRIAIAFSTEGGPVEDALRRIRRDLSGRRVELGPHTAIVTKEASDEALRASARRFAEQLAPPSTAAEAARGVAGSQPASDARDPSTTAR
jgi:hypothetical protein